jgi:hypothetical protein
MLDVGQQYFGIYFAVRFLEEGVFAAFGKDPVKCLLLICVNIGFIIILKNRSNSSNQGQENSLI